MSTGYQIVREEEIAGRNKYYELLFLPLSKKVPSIYFFTNEANLENVGKAIVNEKGMFSKIWRIIPHSKVVYAR